MFVWCMHMCRGQMTCVTPQNLFLETQSLTGLEFNRQAKLAGWRAPVISVSTPVLAL